MHHGHGVTRSTAGILDVHLVVWFELDENLVVIARECTWHGVALVKDNGFVLTIIAISHAVARGAADEQHTNMTTAAVAPTLILPAPLNFDSSKVSLRSGDASRVSGPLHVVTLIQAVASGGHFHVLRRR